MMRVTGFALGVFALTLASGASADATYQTLYSFTGGTDGYNPSSALVMDAAGNLYGTSAQGGAYGLGTLFELATDGTFSLLHTFKGGRDGAGPTAAALAMGNHGTLYGLTVNGGAANGGTAWRYRNGRMVVLHSFGVGQDGYAPSSGVMLEPDGSLVGTTGLGGGAGCPIYKGCGALFRVASDGSETLLHTFAGGASDGSDPAGTPVRDLAGNYYGATSEGGPHDAGTVYKVAPDGTESLVYALPSTLSEPLQGLTIDKHGNLFGTTQYVGNQVEQTLFEIDAQGQKKNVFDFSNLGYGTGLQALLRESDGSLVGTLSRGGGNQTGGCVFAGGCGALFVVTPAKQMTVLHAFGGTDGLYPGGGVVRDASGNFYGTTSEGGAYSHGTIFKITMGTK
jgi:uncharacterized repeat protein (TIGR03803 family)